MSGTNAAQMKFMAFPGMPTCATGAVASGDPTKGPSVILSKAATGCTFPWHWHTPSEHVMMVSGSARVEMKDAKPVTLKAGGFALMPSKHVHLFKCLQACMLFIYSDAPFDMHYVDDKGAEITPDEALKKVKETAAKAGP
ncbi:MAG TPA: cupin domain-containing protein [Thermoanaerobaculia bacterium]|jgi:quercetin dioxygenase-like cupin family protein|nr:cupin domain-containing protein [Thermoanaerobaculia bacterium]